MITCTFEKHPSVYTAYMEYKSMGTISSQRNFDGDIVKNLTERVLFLADRSTGCRGHCLFSRMIKKRSLAVHITILVSGKYYSFTVYNRRDLKKNKASSTITVAHCSLLTVTKRSSYDHIVSFVLK